MKTLKAGRIELRQPSDLGLPILYAWRNASDFMHLCSTRRNTVSFEEFVAELKRDFTRDRHLQYLIYLGEQPIGTIFSYNLNRTDGHVFVTLYLAGEYRKRGYGVEACVTFLAHLFEKYDLYKVYLEAYAYNSASIGALEGAGLVEEGRFRGHRFVNGERHDLIRYAVFKTDATRYIALVRRLTRKARTVV